MRLDLNQLFAWELQHAQGCEDFFPPSISFLTSLP